MKPLGLSLRRPSAPNRSEKLVDGFTKRYIVVKLVNYEAFSDYVSANERDKQVKGGSRAKKIALIAAQNPDWRDLYDSL